MFIVINLIRKYMLNWCPLRNFTHYSLLKGFSKPSELASKCKSEGYIACGISDYKTISGAVAFYKACKKSGIKPIIGCSFDDFTLFAKNKNGWYDLIQLVSSLDNEGNLNRDILSSILKKQNIIKVDNNINLLPVSYYVNSEDAKLHRILLCSELKTTLPKINKLIHSGELDKNIEYQFTHDDLCVWSKDKLQSVAQNTNKKDLEFIDTIINSCEEYDILSKPMLPVFPCPDNQSEEDYLKQLCRDGWKTLLIKNNKVSNPEDKQKYAERFDEEFNVIKNANLFGYFLIVQDIIKYVNDQGWLSGPGRGSAAGCLISYLIGITKIDPLEFDLLFSRFYNAGRNSADHISLPDIDMDVPAKRRDDVLLYLKNKYGHDHVSQMITFGRLQGRSAIKEVLRVNEACSFAEMNTITKSIPNEAEISDQLADMDDEDRSIIRWALLNNADDLRDFCHINEDGKLDGDYAEYFDQAIKIEGTFKTQGKHAAGVVISKHKLNTVCPMVDQRDSSEKIAGLEMADLESLGHVKFDVLGLSLLDKLMFIQDKETING
ncbi:PHP domain-containing protein [bacterium]|nr:PHP domain-containing protein [bacterium]